MIALLLALFPVLFLLDTRLGVIALVLAIGMLSRKRTRTATRRASEAADTRPTKAWEDPWGTGGIGKQQG
jgi:hypothetical protein